MKSRMLVVALALTPSLGLLAQAQGTIQSIYTDLEGAKCRTVKVERLAGASVESCPGVGGFHLLVESDDDRMSVAVVGPDRREHNLDYWNVVTRAFSSLGKKAEWVVTKRDGKMVPIALIVRVNATVENDGKPKQQSFLTVAKLTADQSCVTDKIASSANANAKARKAAETAASRPCLKGD